MLGYALLVVPGLLALGLFGALLARWGIGRWLVYGGCLLLSLADLWVVQQAGPAELVLPIGLPWIGAHFAIDHLSRVFLVLLDLGAAAASLYALGYGTHEEAPHRVLPFFPAFLAGMHLVLLAADAYSFLFGWEVMSFASWALVLADHRNAENARAGLVYIVMATLGALCLLLGFGILADSGGYEFAAMRAAVPGPVGAGLVLALALLGAGSKAGLVPMHAWLPLAHPAAPSHVSALMSGVMTKIAIYAFLRIVFDLAGGGMAWWWAIPVLVLGGASAVMGVFLALLERDLKRLLACSTIENIGIIFIGIGLAMAFRADGMVAVAALALTAALFHAFNHMLFKSLLFQGAGAVLAATGLRDIAQLGGLIKTMKSSSVAVLIGCLAISALPPLNGFASEWLSFQSVLAGPALPQWGLRLLVPSTGALLALSAALAAACFVRAYGIAWLGRPRSPAAAGSRETDGFSRAAMWLLALACILAGIFPGAVIDALSGAVLQMTGARLAPQLDIPWLSIVPVADRASSYNGLMVLLFVTATAVVVATGARAVASRALRRPGVWDCGYPNLSVRTQYSATSHSQPIRRVLGPLLARTSERVEMPPPGSLEAAGITRHVHDLSWDAFYAPPVALVGVLATWLNRMQFLTIRVYLSFVFAALVLLLLGLTLWQ